VTASKLVDRDEFIRWYNDGKTYKWIIEKYLEKYDLEIGNGTISNWRSQLELEKRAVRDVSLIPWAVNREHRYHHTLHMLRTVGRLRAGEPTPEARRKKAKAWLRNLEEQDAVVHYDPDTEEGWWLVPRRHGIDTDIIRKPDRVTRQRKARE